MVRLARNHRARGYIPNIPNIPRITLTNVILSDKTDVVGYL